MKVDDLPRKNAFCLLQNSHWKPCPVLSSTPVSSIISSFVAAKAYALPFARLPFLAEKCHAKPQKMCPEVAALPRQRLAFCLLDFSWAQ
jgi:hypothetical protein